MTTTPNKLLPVDSVAQEKMMWCWAACSQMVLQYLQRPGQLELSLERGWVGGSDDPVPSQGELVEWRRSQDGKPHIDCRVPPGPKATDAEEDEWYKVCNWGGWPNLGGFNDLVENSTWASTRYTLTTRGLRLEAGGPLLRIDDEPSDEEKRRFSAEELRQRFDERLRHVAFNSGPAFSQALANAEDCALSWPMLKRLVDEGSPVIFSWRYGSSAGHLMVAAGYLSIPRTETAKETHWVFVRDSWPPLSGDGYLIPHDYYVKGPGDRHWRDYWIRTVGGTSPYSLPWEKAFVPSPKGPPSPSADAKVAKKTPATKKPKLEKRLRQAVSEAKPKADDGLAALQAIVEGDDALDMALALGMGVIWMKATARVVADALAAALGALGGDLTALDSWEDIDAKKYLGPEDKDLEFFVDDGQPTAIPVFHVSREDLKAWDGDSNKLPLPETPTELVFPVRWPGQEPFELFSTVTVRSSSSPSKSARDADSWQVVNIGRASIMQALGMSKWAKTRGLDSDDRSWLFTREGLTEKLPRILKELGLINAAARQEGPAEWLIGLLTDLRLDKTAWRAASRLSGRRDRALQGLLKKLSDEEDGQEGQDEQNGRARARKVLSEMSEISSLREWRDWLDALLSGPEGPPGWKDLKPLIIGPDRDPDQDLDEQGSSVLHKLWPLLLKEGHALEARPSEPSEEDRNDVRALAQAVDEVLESFRPSLLAARIEREQKEATAAGAFLKEAKDLKGPSRDDALRELARRNQGIDDVLRAADDLEQVATKQAAMQANELAQAALDGWNCLRKLDGADPDLEAKPEKPRKAATKQATAKENKEDQERLNAALEALEERLAKRGVAGETMKSLIEAVKVGWECLDKHGWSRFPKPSLDGWNLPEYVIDVPELYQQFLVYGDDDIVQAYPEDFYPRPNRVRPKDKVDLLKQLKKLAS
jgi:hypothetical protein